MPPKRQPLATADPNTTNVKEASDKGKGKAPAKATSKRKASAIDPVDVPEIDDDDARLQDVTDDCNQVRQKINNFIDSGAMKVGAFQKAINVSAKEYNLFMGQTWANSGSTSETYFGAFRFFKKRELQGLKMPPVKTPPAKKAKTSTEDQQKWNVDDIELEGEAENEVEVYDTCDELRKKIRAHLKHPGVTQAGLCREFAKTFKDGKKLTGSQLSTFLGYKGPSKGNTSKVFYAGYVYFEKLRIKQQKKKSKFREEMEELWTGSPYTGWRPGFDIWTPPNPSYIVGARERIAQDKYGMIHVY